MELSWAHVFVPFLSAGAGAYLGGYLKKKGENLATHEDINNLNEQVRVVTTTTKEIEAKISNEMWNRQKRWEMKREVLFEVAKSIADLDDALNALNLMVLLDENRGENYDKWVQAHARFHAANLLARIACDPETVLDLHAFGAAQAIVAAQIVDKKDKQVYTSSMKERATKLWAATTAVRKELGLSEPEQRPTVPAGQTASSERRE